MCLSKITEKYDNPSPMIQSGFKEFTGTGNSLKFQFNSAVVEFDKWLTGSGKVVEADDKKKYTADFHIYCDESQKAELYGPRLIYYRNVHTRGFQGKRETVIAKEIYVPSDLNGWPPTKTEEKAVKETILEKAKKLMSPKGNA